MPQPCEEALVLFVEQYPLCMPCGVIDGYISPFTIAPTCYKVLAENEDWITVRRQCTRLNTSC